MRDRLYNEGIKLEEYKCPGCSKKQNTVVWTVQRRMNESFEYLLNLKTGLAERRTWWNHDVCGDEFECPQCGAEFENGLRKKLHWRKFQLDQENKLRTPEGQNPDTGMLLVEAFLSGEFRN